MVVDPTNVAELGDGVRELFDRGVTAISLNPNFLDAAANDVGANWCPGSNDYGDLGANFGTPGMPNDPCP